MRDRVFGIETEYALIWHPRGLLDEPRPTNLELYRRFEGALLARVRTLPHGFSWLRHIVVTSPYFFKIDRSIVAVLDVDPVLTKLVQSLVAFGHGCDVRVVAEGIETADEAAALRALGVDYGQGWFYGRPGPPEALGDLATPGIPRPRRAPAEFLAG